jgi:hypothetical protein
MFDFLGVKDRDDVAILMKVLNEHCQIAGIARECPERLEVAKTLVKLFRGGARTPEELRAALKDRLKLLPRRASVSPPPRGSARH